MRKWGRGGLFSGAVVAAGLFLAAAEPALAQDGYAPVLFGNGAAFCGPCEPAPTVTRAAPGTAVIAHRYRWSAEERTFQPVGVGEVGVTDHQGELRFAVPNAESALDKIVVSVGELLLSTGRRARQGARTAFGAAFDAARAACG